MKRVQKFIVVPVKLVKGRPYQGEVRMASCEESALRLAGRMAERFDGVAAYEVHVDMESGDMHDPRELVVHGRAPVLQSAEAA